MKNVFLPNFPFLSLLFMIFSSMYSASIFSIGYIAVAGALLILGPFKLFMRNIGNTRNWFQYLLAYNLLVITMKFILCTSVEQVPITEPVLRFIFMDWSLFDPDSPCTHSPKGKYLRFTVFTWHQLLKQYFAKHFLLLPQSKHVSCFCFFFVN